MEEEEDETCQNDDDDDDDDTNAHTTTSIVLLRTAAETLLSFLSFVNSPWGTWLLSGTGLPTATPSSLSTVTGLGRRNRSFRMRSFWLLTRSGAWEATTPRSSANSAYRRKGYRRKLRDV